jgi:hemerythrin
MLFISWDEIYSVNNREIDSQHQTIIRLINELNDGAYENKRTGSIERILYELVKYTAFHFSFEEKLMVQFGYPDTKSHMSKHNYLIEELKKFMVKNGNENNLPANDLMIFLSDWLKTHIMGVDKKYSTFLSDNSIN